MTDITPVPFRHSFEIEHSSIERNTSIDSRKTSVSILSHATSVSSFKASCKNMVQTVTQCPEEFPKRVVLTKLRRNDSQLVKKIVFLTGRLIITYIICWAPSTFGYQKKSKIHFKKI